jgi:RNA polymerase sigma-70 factor (ECF subfamily)
MEISTKKPSEVLATGRISTRTGFEDIILEHTPRLWSVALSFCRYNHLEAQDLFQEAMIRAFRYRQSLESAENKYGWLRKTLLSTHLNRLGDNKRWNSHEDISLAEEIPSFDPMPVSELVTDIFKKDLWDDDILHALDGLPEEHRTVLLLSDVEGFTREEITELTGLSMGTVSSHIFRSRKKLAKILKDYAIIGGYVGKEKLAAETEVYAKQMKRANEMRM